MVAWQAQAWQVIIAAGSLSGLRDRLPSVPLQAARRRDDPTANFNRKGDAMIRGKPKPGTIRMRRYRARLRWVNDPAGYYLLRHKRKHPTPRQCGGRPPTEADWARVLFTQPFALWGGE